MMLSHVDLTKKPDPKAAKKAGTEAPKDAEMATDEETAAAPPSQPFTYEMAEAADSEYEDMSEPDVEPRQADNKDTPRAGPASKGPLKPITELHRATPPPKLAKEIEDREVALATAAGPSAGTSTGTSGGKKTVAASKKPDPNQPSISSFFTKPAASGPKPQPWASSNKPILVDTDSDSDLSHHSDSEDSSSELSLHTDSSTAKVVKKTKSKVKGKGKEPADSTSDEGKPAVATPKKKKTDGAGPAGRSPNKEIGVEVSGNKKRIVSKNGSPTEDTAPKKKNSDGKNGVAPKPGAQKSMLSYMKKDTDDDDGVMIVSQVKSPAKTKQQSLDNIVKVSPKQSTKPAWSGDKLRIHQASVDYQIYRTERSLGFLEVPIPNPPGHPRKNLIEAPLRDDFDLRVARMTSGLPDLTEMNCVSETPADALRSESMTWRRLTPTEWIMGAEVAEFFYVWGKEAVAVEDEPEPVNKGKRKGRGRWSKQTERKPGTTWEAGVLEQESCEITNFMRTVENPEECIPFLLKLYSRLFFRITPDVEPPACELVMDYPHILRAMAVPFLPPRLAPIFAANRAEVIPPHLHIRALNHLINHYFVDLDAFNEAYNDCAKKLESLDRAGRSREKRRKEIAVEMEEAKKATAEAGEAVTALEKELYAGPADNMADWDFGGSGVRQKLMEVKKSRELERSAVRSKIKHAITEHNICKRKETSLEHELEKLAEDDAEDEEEVAFIKRQLNRGRASAAVRESGKDRYGRVWWWLDLEDLAAESEPASDVESGSEEKPASPRVKHTKPFGLMIESLRDLDTPVDTPVPEESKFFYFSNLKAVTQAFEKLNDKGIRERPLKNAVTAEFKARKISTNPAGGVFGGERHGQQHEDAYKIFLDTIASNRGELLQMPQDIDIEALEQESLELILTDLPRVIPAFRKEDLEAVAFETVLRLLAPKVQASDNALVPTDYKVQVARSLRALNEGVAEPAAMAVDAAVSVQETASVNEDEEAEVSVVVERPVLSTMIMRTLDDLHVWCLRLYDHQKVYEEKLAKEMAKREPKGTRDLRKGGSDKGASGSRAAAIKAGGAITRDSRADSRDSDSEDDLTRGSRPTRSNTVTMDPRKQAQSSEPKKRAAAVRAAKLVTDDAVKTKNAADHDMDEADEADGKLESDASNASFKEKSSDKAVSEDEELASASEEDASDSGSEASGSEGNEDEGKRRSALATSKPSKSTSRTKSSRSDTRKLKRKSRGSGDDEEDQSSEEEAPRRKLLRRKKEELSEEDEGKERGAGDSPDEIVDSSEGESKRKSSRSRR